MQQKPTNSRQSELIRRLHDPEQLGMFVCGLMLLVGLLVIDFPMSDNVAAAKLELIQARKLQSLAADVDNLRSQFDRVKPRLPGETDTNEWIQYVLDGIRQLPLTLVSLDSDKPRRLEPFTLIVLKIQIQGQFHDLDAFLQWLEVNDRLLQVDSIKLVPVRGAPEVLMMHLTVLGVMS